MTNDQFQKSYDERGGFYSALGRAVSAAGEAFCRADSFNRSQFMGLIQDGIESWLREVLGWAPDSASQATSVLRNQILRPYGYVETPVPVYVLTMTSRASVQGSELDRVYEVLEAPKAFRTIGEAKDYYRQNLEEIGNMMETIVGPTTWHQQDDPDEYRTCDDNTGVFGRIYRHLI